MSILTDVEYYLRELGGHCERLQLSPDGTSSPTCQYRLTQWRKSPNEEIELLSGEQVAFRFVRESEKEKWEAEREGRIFELLPVRLARRLMETQTFPPANWYRRIDQKHLAPRELHGNCSILRHQGKWLFAYRLGFYDTRFAIAELDESFTPVSNHVSACQVWLPNIQGIEDPRLFAFRGKLHCAFGVKTGGRFSQWYSELDADYDCVRPEYARPHRPGRHEKNWQFFEHEERLLAVYSIAPHVVLEIQPGRCVLLSEQAHRIHWPFGEPRGGTPPVRIGDEYFSFFHSSQAFDGRPYYVAGFYSFAAEPPFAIRRMSVKPVLAPDIYAQPNPEMLPTAFPCGASYEQGRWTVSFGEWDWHCGLAEFDHEKLLAGMQPVQPR